MTHFYTVLRTNAGNSLTKLSPCNQVHISCKVVVLLFWYRAGCEHDSLPHGGVAAPAADRPAARRLQRDDARVLLPDRHLPTRRKGLITEHHIYLITSSNKPLTLCFPRPAVCERCPDKLQHPEQ